MQYALPKRTETLGDWCIKVSTVIGMIKDLEQQVSYDAAVESAKRYLAFFKASVENFAERSFVLALRPHINPYDLGYTKL